LHNEEKYAKIKETNTNTERFYILTAKHTPFYVKIGLGHESTHTDRRLKALTVVCYNHRSQLKVIMQRLIRNLL